MYPYSGVDAITRLVKELLIDKSAIVDCVALPHVANYEFRIYDPKSQRILRTLITYEVIASNRVNVIMPILKNAIDKFNEPYLEDEKVHLLKKLINE